MQAKEVSLRKLENIFFLMAFLISIAVFYGSSVTDSRMSSTTLTARTYGMIISGGLVLVSGGILVKNFLAASKKAESKKVTFSEIPRVLLCAIVMLLYCFGINNVGYFTSTTLFLWLMLIVLSGKKSVKAIVIQLACSVAFNFLLYYLFQLMKVFMPTTPLI